MHGVFHVVFEYVFYVCDCVIVCYTLRGKHIHGMMYMGNECCLNPEIELNCVSG